MNRVIMLRIASQLELAIARSVVRSGDRLVVFAWLGLEAVLEGTLSSGIAKLGDGRDIGVIFLSNEEIREAAELVLEKAVASGRCDNTQRPGITWQGHMMRYRNGTNAGLLERAAILSLLGKQGYGEVVLVMEQIGTVIQNLSSVVLPDMTVTLTNEMAPAA